jgi:hypothetical protein
MDEGRKRECASAKRRDEHGDAGGVAARLVQTGDKAKLDRIVAGVWESSASRRWPPTPV